MKPSTILSGLIGLALASFTTANADVDAGTNKRTTIIYIQAVTAAESPAAAAAPLPLAELQYDVLAPSEAQVISYEAPDLPEDARLVRVGLYDASNKRWTSSTSVASVANFEKGYSPALMLSVDREGHPIGAAIRGVAIDAGQTRDFGPQAAVLVTEAGKQPDLNKPVVLSHEGKQVVPEEKSMLQKYVVPLLYSTLLYSTLLYSTLLYSTLPYSTLLGSR